MSTGLKITKATYGAGSKTEDVTRTVTQNVKGGSINLVVSPDSLNVNDPAPGQLKTLNVSYTINNGSTNTQSVNDNEVFMVSAPPQTTASGLQIQKAEYGYAGNYTDVTKAVQKLVSNGSINLKVGFKEVGIPDPNPNKQKELKVDYTLNEELNTAVYKDGETFTINAPAGVATSNATPTDDVGNFFGILWSNAIRGVGIFLYVISGLTLAYLIDPNMGTPLKMVVVIINCYFAFWAWPLYLFFRRILFTDEVSLPSFEYTQVI